MRGGPSGRPQGGIKYVSLLEPSGYGTAARRYLAGLGKAGVPLTWTPLVHRKSQRMWYAPFEGRSTGDPEMDAFCNRRIGYDTLILHTVPEYYPLWAERERGKKIIGCTVWETDGIPDHWADLLNKVDHLFVPCRWNREVFKKCGVTTPVDVIPHIVAGEALPECPRPEGIGPDDYVFYTIGAWTARKAIGMTVRSYLDTFDADDPVVLIVKTTERDFTRRFMKRFFGSTHRSLRMITRRYRRPARIRLITEEVSDEDILKIHAAADCYVSLCRSEGWGLGAFDAAGFGRPVIITGFGGQLDYLPRDLAFLVDYSTVAVEDAAGRKSYSRNQNWAEPDIAHGSALMRYVFDHRDTAGARGRALREHVRKNFGESLITGKMIDAVSRITQFSGERHAG
jgi:glycosyltransferase involved in cell wall biosynthesis